LTKQNIAVFNGFSGFSETIGEARDLTDTTAILPGYATVNLLASYSWKIGDSKLTTQFNVNNLLDKAFYPTSFGQDSIEVGAPRTFMGSVRIGY
jgi:iron complex outermembrane receptor protein